MPTYLVSFEEFLKMTQAIDDYTTRTAFWWEEEYGVVMEYPVMTSAGRSTGVVFRCELANKEMAGAIVVLFPDINIDDGVAVANVFKKVYLERFKRVLGKKG